MGKPAGKRDLYLICGLLVVVTAAVYWQVAEFELINFDDYLYVRDNPLVQAGVMSPTAVRLAFLPYEANWIPLVWISYMVEHDIGAYILDSETPAIHHITNALLHITNAVLLFLVLFGMTGWRWRSAFVAALFALHPLHVESVAWVAERKDVLSTFFWLLTMLAYLRYTRLPTARNYGTVILLFALGLMAKSMLVTLPIALLLLDYWPLGRIRNRAGSVEWPALRRMLIEKTPLFALALAGCIITVWAQSRGGAVGSLEVYPLGVRLANALVAYMAYIGKMFWPAGLCFLYPHPGSTLPHWQVVASGILLVGLTALAFAVAPRRSYVLTGWLWYVITLLPVIGIIQVGKQAMADRYTYVPLIGLFIIVAWGVPDLLARAAAAGESLRPVIAVFLGICAIGSLAVLTVLCYRQLGYWRDSIALCKHAVQVCEANPMAHFNLGAAFADRGEADLAVQEYRRAIKMRPDFVDAYYNLATTLAKQGRLELSARYFRKVLRIAPDYAEAHDNFGIVLAQQGRLDDAIWHFSQALRLDPNNQRARENLETARAAKLGEH